MFEKNTEVEQFCNFLIEQFVDKKQGTQEKNYRSHLQSALWYVCSRGAQEMGARMGYRKISSVKTEANETTINISIKSLNYCKCDSWSFSCAGFDGPQPISANILYLGR